MAPAPVRSAAPAPKAAGGFTLIEVTIALAVLAIGLLGVAVMQLQALSGGRHARHATEAAVIARDQMENFQRLAWTDPQLDDTGGWTPVANVQSQVLAEDTGMVVQQTFGITWRITDVDPNWMKDVDVQVSWNPPVGPPRTVTLSSVRYNDPW